MNYREQLAEKGYVATPFSVDFEARRELAHLGSQLIDLALEDEKIMRALTFSPQPNCPGKDVTSFQVGVPRVAKDDSIWLHTGWQTEARFNEVFGQDIPRLLKDFLNAQKAVLNEVTLEWTKFLENLLPNPTDAIELFNHQNMMRNNLVLRFVRYPSLDQYTQENGTFSAHGDLNVLTTQLYNSHDGHLNITPYPTADITDKVDEARYKRAKNLRDSKATIAKYDANKEAATFLGFGAANMRNKDGSIMFKGMHAGYHFGIPPNTEYPIDPKAEKLFGKNTRMVVVAFGSPHYDVPYTLYRTPTTEACRPEQVWEKKTKQDT